MRYARILAVFLFVLSVPQSSFAQAQDAAPQPSAVKEWTFLIFLNGNNNLDDFGPMNLNQAETVGSTDGINIVVQWASLRNRDVRRLLVKKDNDPRKVTSPIIENLGKVDMGDYKSLVEFVKWGVANYPAKRYFIDIWNHGSGWHSKRGQITRDISSDDISGNSITTAQLGLALKESAAIIGHKVDLYASDACLMAMAEVAAEMGDYVKVFAGSQDLEPGPGWQYGDFMKLWAAKPTATPQEVGKMLTDSFIASYSGGSNGTEDVTFSVYDMEALPKLMNAVKGFGVALSKLDKAERRKVTQAFSAAQSFTYNDYVDFGDALGLLQKAGISTLDTGMYASLDQAAKSFVIANGQRGRPKATGLSFWAPSDLSTYKEWAPKYDALQFEAGTQWSQTLKYLLQ